MKKKGYNYDDIIDVSRTIIKHIPNGLLLDCGHKCYFGNPEDFTVGNGFDCHDCSFDTIKFKVSRQAEINVSYPLVVNEHELMYTPWDNS